MPKNKRNKSNPSKPYKKYKEEYKIPKESLLLARDVFPLDKLYVALSIELEQFLKTIRRDMSVSAMICEFGKFLTERYSADIYKSSAPPTEQSEDHLQVASEPSPDTKTTDDSPAPPVKNIWRVAHAPKDSTSKEEHQNCEMEAPTYNHLKILFNRAYPGRRIIMARLKME